MSLPQRLEDLFGSVVQTAAGSVSCQQYVAVKQNLVPPDVFRLRNRQALSEVIAGIVRDGASAAKAAIRARIPASVPKPDRDHFIDLALAKFKSLHAGNAVRFGISPLEIAAWLEKARRK